ncbi:CHAD domain-containing protein [Streptomyces sp. NPDC001514]
MPAARTTPGGDSGAEPPVPPSGLTGSGAQTAGTTIGALGTLGAGAGAPGSVTLGDGTTPPAAAAGTETQDRGGAPDHGTAGTTAGTIGAGPAGTPSPAAYITGHGGTRAEATAAGATAEATAAGAVGAAAGVGGTTPARGAGAAGSATLGRGASPARGAGATAQAVRSGTSAAAGVGARSALTVGAARAGALLDRQLTLGRTRAHSAALQALGSSRFHAVADAVALLASEVPLAAAAAAPADVLDAHAETAERRLLDAVAVLPLARAAHPYNADALVHGLATTAAGEAQDAPWHHVRLLLRLHRYAQEVTASVADPLLTVAARALDRHRDAAEAASAAASAARTPRIAPATAYALGVLHADQRHEVEAARFTFHQVWQRQTVAAP